MRRFSNLLEPQELENQYRRDRLSQDKHIIFTILLIASLIIVGFIIIDSYYLTNTQSLKISLISRIIAIFASLLSIRMIRHQSNIKQFDRTVFIWVMINFAHLAIVSAVRPADFITVSSWDVFALFAIYTFAPFALTYKMISALFFSLSSVIIMIFFKTDAQTGLERTATFAAYFFVNFYGIFLSNTLDQSRRKQFLHSLKEKNARKELADKNVELKKIVQEKTNALEINQLLIREMNHRVKNNLAMIKSLLNIQSKKAGNNESSAILKESANRVQSISNIHDLLSKTIDLKSVPVNQYVRSLVEDLAHNFNVESSNIKISLQLDEVVMDMNKLIPFALILNELITNAFKYAFHERDKSELQISLEVLNHNQIKVVVKDNGVGLPDGFNLEESNSLGMQIISSLIQQLEGRLEYQSSQSEGTEFKIHFNYTARQ